VELTAMSRARNVTLVAAVAVVALRPAPAAADNACYVVDVALEPATSDLQIVAWIEDPAGHYVATVFITRETGSYGLGNRPGRMDFNSGWHWPYGRRTAVFPVWAARHGTSFPEVIFQNSPDNPADCLTLSGLAYMTCGDNDLSHPFDQSSRENHYCRPLLPTESDAMTCATQPFTDKGKLSPIATTPYPPRADVVRQAGLDSPSVDMYLAMNPFDAVSRATPAAGTPADITWAVPPGVTGPHVLWVEVARELDMNNDYNPTVFPSPPGISWASYGRPYRGQPSIVYSVPFTISTGTTTVTTTMDYAGYGDPDGPNAVPHMPDATITTTTPGSGASRLQLVSEGGRMYRVKVEARAELDLGPPAAPTALEPVSIATQHATVQFVAPGDDGKTGTATGYEIRLRAGSELTADNFADAMPVTASVPPAVGGTLQTVELDGLLPETDYWVGVRAFDDCRNTGELAIARFTTADRVAGEVSACFVATAAYGSAMANDVEMLRRFRDMALRSTVLGELAVETYYTFGPAVAGVVGSSDLLRATARDVLAPIVGWVKVLAW
jgi:hypothetical protein